MYGILLGAGYIGLTHALLGGSFGKRDWVDYVMNSDSCFVALFSRLTES